MTQISNLKSLHFESRGSLVSLRVVAQAKREHHRDNGLSFLSQERFQGGCW